MPRVTSTPQVGNRTLLKSVLSGGSALTVQHGSQLDLYRTLRACNPSGIAFDSIGNLYIADAASTGNVWKVSPDPTGCASDDSTSAVCTAIADSTSSSPTTPFASVVPGTNGVAFDRDGNLWTGDGTTGLGRVWKIGLGGGNCTLGAEFNCEEVFRIQPMNNSVAFEGDVPNPGVGRVNSTIQPPQAPDSAAAH